MRRFSGILTLIFTALAVAPSASAELKSNVDLLVLYETRGNAVAARSSEKVLIEHFEIPLSALRTEINDRLPSEALNSLVFEKAGQKFVRWVINPEDTKWHRRVSAWLRKRGIPVVKGQYFEGYMTASRSYIVKDPATDYSFSIKVSTNRTGGYWRDKKQSWEDAKQVKLSADLAMEAIKRQKPQHFVFMDEPAIFGIGDLDQGMIVRLLSDLPTSDRFYIPGFSALHEKEGKWLAEHNGSSDPAAFWERHYIRPLGRAIAELMAMTGLSYDSPHSQNFLIETDKDLRPTGRIVFRDLGDSYVSVPFFRAIGRKDFVEVWEKGNLVSNTVQISQGVLHGNSKPSWISETRYDQYGEAFFAEFEKEYSRLTGIPVAALRKDRIRDRYDRGDNGRELRAADIIAQEKALNAAGGDASVNANDAVEIEVRTDYISKAYRAKRPEWSAYFNRLEKNNPLQVPLTCRALFVE